MKDITVVEWLIILVIALILVALFVGSVKNGGEFKRVCDEARGTTVWDGRQYQCIKVPK